MAQEKLTSSGDDLAKGHPATQSAKAAFRNLISDLPKDWKKQMYKRMPSLDTASGATRLTKIRQGAVAPTQAELDAVKKIIDAKPKAKTISLSSLKQLKINLLG
ncbi:MAG: hypothetical protein EOO88_55450 [Pedobacter sp.]|nr:MAG: hypothetical protein EOO88_55450 [Pedobacter sp.]